MNCVAVFYGRFSPVNSTHLSLTLSIRNIMKAKEFLFFLRKDDVPFAVRKSLLKKGIRDYGMPIKGFRFVDQDRKPLYLQILELSEREHTKVCLFVGEDRYEELKKEEQFEKLSRLSHLILLPNHDLHLYPEMDYLDIPATDFDNNLLRNGQDLDTTREVLFEIGDEKLYFCHEISSMMKESRYRHSVSVAKTAYAFANKSTDIQPKRAFQAGIFHDCGKDLPVSTQKEIVEEHFREFLPCPEFAYHQFVSEYLAEEKFQIHDKEVLSSVMYHCTGKADMDVLEKIIYAADKDEPTRQFETKKARNACYRDIDKGFVVTLKEQEEYFKKKNIPYMEHFLSKEMYHQYLGEENNA